jgi:hypothetical protein
MVCEKTQAIILVRATQGPTSSRRGDEAYITHTEVSEVGVTSTTGEGKSPSP